MSVLSAGWLQKSDVMKGKQQKWSQASVSGLGATSAKPRRYVYEGRTERCNPFIKVSQRAARLGRRSTDHWSLAVLRTPLAWCLSPLLPGIDAIIKFVFISCRSDCLQVERKLYLISYSQNVCYFFLLLIHFVFVFYYNQE